MVCQQVRFSNVYLRTVVHGQIVNVRRFGGIPLRTVVQRHIEQATLINLITGQITVCAAEDRARPDAVGAAIVE
ncbi:hypothetical protein D3C80_2183240 [compost metagenome]